MIVEGFYWPDHDKRAHGVILRDVKTDVPALLKFIPGRKCIVQAGGNVGVYAKALAEHFQLVVTVEPDPANYACLSANLGNTWGIRHMQAAFGETEGRASIDAFEPDNIGAHRLKAGADFSVIRIDDVPLTDCDAIWLDVEGSELSALKGAQETIERFSPVIAFEDKGLDRHYGVAHGETKAWVEALGYSQIAEIGRDKIFRR